MLGLKFDITPHVLSASVAPLWIDLLLKIKFPSVGSDIIQSGTPLERIHKRSSLVAIFFQSIIGHSFSHQKTSLIPSIATKNRLFSDSIAEAPRDVAER